MADYFIGAIKYNHNMKQELQRYRTTTRSLSLTRSPSTWRESSVGFEPSPCSFGRLSIGHYAPNSGYKTAAIRLEDCAGSAATPPWLRPGFVVSLRLDSARVSAPRSDRSVFAAFCASCVRPCSLRCRFYSVK